MSSSKSPSPPSVSLLLRVLAGGYLVYLAWSLYRDVQGDWKSITAAIVFGIVGITLAIMSGKTLIQSDYFRSKPSGEKDSDDDSQEDDTEM